MNSRHWDLTETLCVRVRALTVEQAMFLTGTQDRANFRRFLAPLEARGFVRLVRVLAKPVPAMRAPLYTSDPAIQCGWMAIADAHRLALKLARARWAPLSARPLLCIIATRRAGRLFGVRRDGLLLKPLQATHDLAVAAVFLRFMHQGGDAQNWNGEDLPHRGPTDRVIPDALVTKPKLGHKVAIEVIGAEYDAPKLRDIHEHCNAKGFDYELW